MTPRDAIAEYGAAWNERDEGARRELLERVWADDGVYCDPSAVVEGREALVAHLGGFHERMPGHTIVLTTAVDEHHDRLRFGWRMLGPDGEPALDGMDFVALDGDGRIRRVVGFFGPLTPAEPG